MSSLKAYAGVVCLFAMALAVQGQELLPDTPQPMQVQTSDSTAAPPVKCQTGSPMTSKNKPQHAPSQHHIFWVIPNYREDETGGVFKPLTPKEKLRVAVDDSFDPSAFLVAGVFAGNSMLQRQYLQFGDGAKSFAEYFGGAFADQSIGNMMSEALFPIMLRQDPRYFPRGKGGFWKRAGYAVSREVITVGDDGREHFNTSEIAGNGVAAGISNLYYPAADRSLSNTANKWAQQLALDTVFNIMKEYWPDVRQKLFGK